MIYASRKNDGRYRIFSFQGQDTNIGYFVTLFYVQTEIRYLRKNCYCNNAANRQMVILYWCRCLLQNLQKETL